MGMKQHLAATTIQKHWKAYLARLAVVRLRAAVKIQSFARMVIQREKYGRHLQHIKATVIIQKNLRRVLAMKLKTKKIKSVVTIQSFARTFILKRHYLALKQATIQ